jgi:hypothetical protein
MTTFLQQLKKFNTMKNTIGLIVLLMLFNFTTFANQVDENTAKQVGLNFLTTKTNAPYLLSGTRLTLAYVVKSNANSSNTTKKAITYLYVFNSSNKGFVMVAGDDVVTPILAYSHEGAFDPSNIPPNTAKWLEGYKNQIRFAIENEIEATEEIKTEWKYYYSGVSSVTIARRTTAINPLIKTKWDQSPYYNALCPYDYQYNESTVTGCVATAMAQILKFWNYPATGSGFHSYNHSKYGTISANFGGASYQWASMPNNVSGNNNAVATLMYHCGVSIDMNYDVSSNGGSGAYVISDMSPVQHCSEYALKTYFGYKNTMQGVQRVNYTETQWINLLKTELNASRPVLYAGFGSGGGHAFVCDGYDINNFFHFNWGWGGAYDGYFSINALNPSGTGTGGGSGGFNSGHQALIKIEPPAGLQTFNLSLYDFVTPSSSTIGYGQSFSVSTNIANDGSNTFNGDYCAAVFDNQYNFIDYVQVLSGYSLQGGYVYTNNLVFNNSGLFGMLPGTYYIGIFYRPTGGNWVQVSSSGSYTNLVQMTVVNYNNISLNSVMTVTPGTTITQSQTASVNLNILNNGATTFTGQYMVGLYNLDGTYVQTIATLTENNGLLPNYTYISPFLTFSNTITANPGTYLLAVQHKPNNSANWQLTGSTSAFLNPIKVIVQAPVLSPDQYEVNNSLNQTYTLPISFSGNTATRNTIGSNLHIGTDNDFYKIQLPAGYNYTINARLHDSYNSGNGNSYTCDALFSYSTDGITWSDAYDDVLGSSINVSGGKTLFFQVSPYFSGETGTYLLDMTISRVLTTSISEIEINKNINIFPNPTKGTVIIDFKDFNETVKQINILNVQGQVISTLNGFNQNKQLQISLAEFASGIYFIQIHSKNGILTKKITLEK